MKEPLTATNFLTAFFYMLPTNVVSKVISAFPSFLPMAPGFEPTNYQSLDEGQWLLLDVQSGRFRHQRHDQGFESSHQNFLTHSFPVICLENEI